MKLEEIQALIDGATLGPWAPRQTEQSKDELLEGIGAMLEKGGSVFCYVICDEQHPDDNESLTVAHVGNGPNGVANTKFIVAARTLMPLLLKVAQSIKDTTYHGHRSDFGKCGICAALKAIEDAHV